MLPLSGSAGIKYPTPPGSSSLFVRLFRLFLRKFSPKIAKMAILLARANTLVNHASLHHKLHILHQLDVFQRIAIDSDDIRPFAHIQ
jgi:hypothetical protein